MTENITSGADGFRMENVSKSYRSRQGQVVQALTDVSLSVAPGEFVAVQGPSGSGKTTLLLVAGTLLQPDRGRVVLGGSAPYELPPDERARFRARAVGFVFQQFHLVPYLSVLDNVLAATLAGSVDSARDRASQLIDRFGLRERSSHVPDELSTGERQRVALARALLHQPRLLLADEPTGNLDSGSAEAVLNHLEEFAREGGSVLLVTHDERAASRAARILRLRAGRAEGQIVTKS